MKRLSINIATGRTAFAVTGAMTGALAIGAAHAAGMHGMGMTGGRGGFVRNVNTRQTSFAPRVHSAVRRLNKDVHVAGHGKDDEFKFKHEHDRDHDRGWRHDHDVVVLIDPPVIVQDPGVSVIGDDPKDGGKTVEKKAAPACKWLVVKVSVTNYGQTTGKEKAAWIKKFEEKALDYAKEFVKKNASRLGQTIMKAIIEDTTITRTMDVLITYACVDDQNNVVATKVVGPIEDQYAMHWWTGAKLDEGNEHGKQSAIAKNKPTAQPVVAKK